MLSGKAIALGVPVLVVAGFAGQTMFSSKLTGDMVSAHWDSAPIGFVDVTPIDTAEGRAYSVVWQACTLNPDYEHRICMYAGGLAPKSAIQPEGIGTVGINLDVSMLSVQFSKGGEDCTSGMCVPFTPDSVPLHGHFAIYQGPGSSVEHSNGMFRRDNIWPFGGITSSESFSGNKTRYSANFSGVVGTMTVMPPPVGSSNASLMVMKGQQQYQTVYPPVY